MSLFNNLIYTSHKRTIVQTTSLVHCYNNKNFYRILLKIIFNNIFKKIESCIITKYATARFCKKNYF